MARKRTTLYERALSQDPAQVFTVPSARYFNRLHGEFHTNVGKFLRFHTLLLVGPYADPEEVTFAGRPILHETILQQRTDLVDRIQDEIKTAKEAAQPLLTHTEPLRYPTVSDAGYFTVLRDNELNPLECSFGGVRVHGYAENYGRPTQQERINTSVLFQQANQ